MAAMLGLRKLKFPNNSNIETLFHSTISSRLQPLFRPSAGFLNGTILRGTVFRERDCRGLRAAQRRGAPQGRSGHAPKSPVFACRNGGKNAPEF
jgi:hypothetical protein